MCLQQHRTSVHALICVQLRVWQRQNQHCRSQIPAPNLPVRSTIKHFHPALPRTSSPTKFPALSFSHSLFLSLSLFAHKPAVNTGWSKWRHTDTLTQVHTYAHSQRGHPGTNTALSACPLSFALCQLMTRSNFTWQSGRQREASWDVTAMTSLACRHSFLIKNLTNPQQLPLYFVNELLIWNNALANIVRAEWPYQGHAILLYTVCTRLSARGIAYTL